MPVARRRHLISVQEPEVEQTMDGSPMTAERYLAEKKKEAAGWGAP